MRFQTKLVLTMVVTITGVTLALLAATEHKIRQGYTRQFEREFKGIIDQLDESRKSRSQEFLALGSTLAHDPYIVSVLHEQDTTEGAQVFWKGYIASLRELDEYKDTQLPSAAPKRNGNQAPDALSGRIGRIATMDLDGDITILMPPIASDKAPNAGHWDRFNYNETGFKAELKHFIHQKTQQTLYLPIAEDASHPGTTESSAENQSRKGPGRGHGGPDRSKGGKGNNPNQKSNATLIQEMISTPVIDPDSGDVIGLFLRGTPAETGAQKFLERYQSTISSNEPLQNGIYLEGKIYSRTLDESFATELAAIVTDTLETSGQGEQLRYEGEIQEAIHAVYIAPLIDTATPHPAYEVAAFPLTSLYDDLAELRLRGSGIGTGVMLVGILISFLLARNLTIPLKKLVKGTEAIRSGSFDHRVEVSSGDEIGELANSFNEMAGELKQKDLYRELLGKVSDETVAQALVSGSLDLELGGELKEVSVLFCDIRGFTAFTEHMDPTDVIEMLNTHMTAMTQVVRTHLGVVDKFVGDEIMAVFGGLKSYGNDAANAAACALEMIEVREKMNQSLDLPIEVGIGVSTGEVVAGCMGSVDRLNFTVLGARVNLGARLCSAAGNMQVVVDRNTLEAVGDVATAEPLPELKLKGFSASREGFLLKALRTDPGSSTGPVSAQPESVG